MCILVKLHDIDRSSIIYPFVPGYSCHLRLLHLIITVDTFAYLLHLQLYHDTVVFSWLPVTTFHSLLSS